MTCDNLYINFWSWKEEQCYVVYINSIAVVVGHSLPIWEDLQQNWCKKFFAFEQFVFWTIRFHFRQLVFNDSRCLLWLSLKAVSSYLKSTFTFLLSKQNSSFSARTYQHICSCVKWSRKSIKLIYTARFLYLEQKVTKPKCIFKYNIICLILLSFSKKIYFLFVCQKF